MHRSKKQLIATIMLIAGIGLMAYGYWGAFTEAGSRVYDEMDGFTPFFMLIGGGILALTAVVMFLLIRRKARKNVSP